MKSALLVAVDEYDAPATPDLRCIDDANHIQSLLRRNDNGTSNWDGAVVDLESGANADVLRHRLARFFREGAGRELLFYFAGHGANDDWGTSLVLADGTSISLNDVMHLVNNSRATTITLILDCCFSGDVGNLAPERRAVVPGGQGYQLDRAELRDNIAVLAASRSMEPAAETAAGGAFSQLVIEGLEGGASDHRGRVSLLSIYAFVAAGFGALEQTPVLKANLAAPLLLRQAAPWIDDALLEQLPTYFLEVDDRIPLTQAHEGDGREERRGLPFGPTEGTHEQRVFDYLNALREASLVTNDGKRAHFWLTKFGGEVYLTPLGRYFWRLAKEDKL